jgi:hypothetical protein
LETIENDALTCMPEQSFRIRVVMIHPSHECEVVASFFDGRDQVVEAVGHSDSLFF